MVARRTVTLAILVATLAAAVTGCAPSTKNSLPEGVAVSVYQSRSDYSAGLIDVRILNGSDAALTLTEATLDTAQYAAEASWTRGTTLASGATVDLRLTLPEPVCPTPADAKPLVTITFETPDGSTGTASVVADDPIGTLAKLSAEDCIAFEVARYAEIEAAPVLRSGADDDSPAVVEITVTPTGAPGSLTIAQANQTVLLALAGADGAPVTSIPLGIDVTADSAPSVIELPIVPNRCDPHAVAEDKRGTFFPLEVSTSDGTTGVLFVPVSDEVRGQIYDFVGDFCGFPG